MTNGKCPYHQDIEHTVNRLEEKMTRLELGIVGLFAAIIIMLGGTLWTTWDLPARLKVDRDESTHRLLNDIQESLQRLEAK